MKTKNQKLSSIIDSVFKRRPIMANENPAAFEELVNFVLDETDPQTLQECLFARDIVDAEWELLRLHVMKPGVINAVLHNSVMSSNLGKQAQAEIDPNVIAQAKQHMRRATAGDAEAYEAFTEIWPDDKISIDLLVSQVYAVNTAQQLHIERMIAASHGRRKAAYAELERLRKDKTAKAPETSAFVPDVAKDEGTTAPNNGRSKKWLIGG